MVSVKTVGRKVDFVGNCFAESTAYFFFSILNFIFIPNIEIKFFKNNFLVRYVSKVKNSRKMPNSIIIESSRIKLESNKSTPRKLGLTLIIF